MKWAECEKDRSRNNRQWGRGCAGVSWETRGENERVGWGGEERGWMCGGMEGRGAGGVWHRLPRVLIITVWIITSVQHIHTHAKALAWAAACTSARNPPPHPTHTHLWMFPEVSPARDHRHLRQILLPTILLSSSPRTSSLPVASWKLRYYLHFEVQILCSRFSKTLHALPWAD